MTAFRVLALTGLAALLTSGAFAEEKKGKGKLDADGDGAISAEELAKAPEALQAKLKEFDKDGDGALSKEEYEECKKAMKGGKKPKEKKPKEGEGEGGDN